VSVVLVSVRRDSYWFRAERTDVLVDLYKLGKLLDHQARVLQGSDDQVELELEAQLVLGHGLPQSSWKPNRVTVTVIIVILQRRQDRGDLNPGRRRRTKVSFGFRMPSSGRRRRRRRRRWFDPPTIIVRLSDELSGLVSRDGEVEPVPTRCHAPS